jgi:hypothetical protein
MATEFTVEMRIRVRASVAEAFAFFEDPQTTLRDAGMTEASGRMGEGGSGRLVGAKGGLEIVNDWRVIEFDPPRRCVLFQAIAMTAIATGKMARYEVVETNTYSEARRGSSVLTRNLRVRWPNDDLRGMDLIRAKGLVRQRRALAKLARQIHRTPPARPATGVDGPAQGPYLRDTP